MIAKFLDIDPPYTDRARSRFIIVPVPYEGTVSYGRGTSKGPSAILDASMHVEDYDIELDSEPYRAGIHVSMPVKSLKKLTSSVSRILEEKKIPIVLGGEHSITPYAVKAVANKYKDLSVLQLDAHSDLRDSYHGSKNNHACAIRRVLELCPAVQVGIRSMSKGESEFAKSSGQISKIHTAEKLEIVEKVNAQLSKNVYVSIDIDVLDPGIMPSTGTPEPGGLDYYEVLDILKAVAREKNVVGFDLVELAPIKGISAPDFLAARLIYKLMGYLMSGRAYTI